MNATNSTTTDNHTDTRNLTTTDNHTDTRNLTTDVSSKESSTIPNTNCHTAACDTDTSISTRFAFENFRNDSTDVNDTSSIEDSSDVNDASDEMSNSSSENDLGSSFPECIICQTRRQSRALLPCRHSCVCHVCLKQLTRCPMCRADIESYFKLFHSVDDDIDDIEMQIPRDYDSWLGYLYSYIGFP